MKIFFYILMICALSGCAGLTESGVKNLTKVQYVEKGMSKEDVKNIMGSQVVIGYEITDVKAGTTKPLTMPNPYRSETLKDGDRVLDVEFYFTHIRQPDGIVSDDELTPLIFDNNKLTAQGWGALNKIKNKRQ